jgi:hypothetical protein
MTESPRDRWDTPPRPEFDAAVEHSIRTLSRERSSRSIALWTTSGTILSWGQLRGVFHAAFEDDSASTASARRRDLLAVTNLLDAPVDDILEDLVVSFGRRQLVIPASALTSQVLIATLWLDSSRHSEVPTTWEARICVVGTGGYDLVDLLDVPGVALREDVLPFRAVASALADQEQRSEKQDLAPYTYVPSTLFPELDSPARALAAERLRQLTAEASRMLPGTHITYSIPASGLSSPELSRWMTAFADDVLHVAAIRPRQYCRVAVLAERLLRDAFRPSFDTPVFALFGHRALTRGWERTAWLLLLRSLRPRLGPQLQTRRHGYAVTALAALAALCHSAGQRDFADTLDRWVVREERARPSAVRPFQTTGVREVDSRLSGGKGGDAA